MVDSRFTYGQVFFIVIFVAFGLSLVRNSTVGVAANLTALFSLTLMVVDGARNGRRAKLAVMEKFGAAEGRGISSYAFMRVTSPSPRRFKRGDATPQCMSKRVAMATPM